MVRGRCMALTVRIEPGADRAMVKSLTGKVKQSIQGKDLTPYSSHAGCSILQDYCVEGVSWEDTGADFWRKIAEQHGQPGQGLEGVSSESMRLVVLLGRRAREWRDELCLKDLEGEAEHVEEEGQSQGAEGEAIAASAPK
jgi:hypothetical protein